MTTTNHETTTSLNRERAFRPLLETKDDFRKAVEKISSGLLRYPPAFNAVTSVGLGRRHFPDDLKPTFDLLARAQGDRKKY
jgi:hypothetical protein